MKLYMKILIGLGMVFNLLGCGGGTTMKVENIIETSNVEDIVETPKVSQVGPYAYGEFGEVDIDAGYTVPQDVTFIDVRNDWERESGFAAGSIGGAVYQFRDESHPSDGRYLKNDFVPNVKALVGDDLNKHILLICASGSRTKAAAKLLSENGFTYVEHIQGGFNKWKSLDLAIGRN